jgi:hypothetical protein
MLRRGQSLIALFLFLFLSFAACGGEATDETGGPRVVETNPPSEATGIPLSGPIEATFSSRIDPVTVNGDTFILTGVSGEVTYRDQKAIFTPSIPLAGGTTYHAVLTTGIRDLDGVPLSSNHIWSFTTATESGGEEADQIPPEVVSIAPTDGSTDVSINAAIRVTFSEPILPETLRSDTFLIEGVPGEIRYESGSRTATLTPAAALQSETLYQVIVRRGISDLSDNTLAADVRWSFTTARKDDPTPPGEDRIRPTVIERRPTGIDIPLESFVTVQFSEAIRPETLAGNFIITTRGEAIPAEVGYHAATRTARLIPSRLRHGTNYTVVLTHDIRDLAGNRLEHTSWTFRTANRPEEDEED